MNYLLYGKEYFLLKRKLNEIINNSNIDNVISMDFDNIKLIDVITEVCYVDLFNEKKLIILNNFSLKKLKEDEEKELIKHLNSPNENVIIFRLIDDKVDERKKIVKVFRETSEVIFIDKLNRNDLVEYLTKYFNEEKYKISESLIRKIINICGYSYSKDSDNSFIFNEVTKLMNYKMEDKVINEDDLIEVVSKNPDNLLFELVSYVINKDTYNIFKEFKDIKELNIDPHIILAAISKKYREQLQVKVLSETKNKDEIARELNMSSYPVSLLMDSMNKYSYEDLANIIDKLFDCDMLMKTSLSNNLDKYKILEQLFIDL